MIEYSKDLMMKSIIIILIVLFATPTYNLPPAIIYPDIAIDMTLPVEITKWKLSKKRLTKKEY